LSCLTASLSEVECDIKRYAPLDQWLRNSNRLEVALAGLLIKNEASNAGGLAPAGHTVARPKVAFRPFLGVFR